MSSWRRDINCQVEIPLKEVARILGLSGVLTASDDWGYHDPCEKPRNIRFGFHDPEVPLKHENEIPESRVWRHHVRSRASYLMGVGTTVFGAGIGMFGPLWSPSFHVTAIAAGAIMWAIAQGLRS